MIICQDVIIELGVVGMVNIDYVDFIVSVSDNCLLEVEIIIGYFWNINLLFSIVDCDDIGIYQVDLLCSIVVYEIDFLFCIVILIIVD